MGINLYSIIIILIIFILLTNCYQKTQSNNISTSDIDKKLINYKICANKNEDNNNIIDKYNIKSFDVINNNILIHNKFKNELIDYKNQKIHDNDIKNKIKENNQKIIKNNINENANNLIIIELKEENISIIKANKSLKLLLKDEFNDCLRDLHHNNIDKNQINELLLYLTETKKYILEKIEKIEKTILSIDKLSPLYKLYSDQIQLYNKQFKLYNVKFKFYKKIISKI
jgi:hypothetical protein